MGKMSETKEMRLFEVIFVLLQIKFKKSYHIYNTDRSFKTFILV